MGEITFQIIRILTLAAGAAVISFLLTPVWTNFLYKYKLGKSIRKEAGFKSLRTHGETFFEKYHKQKEGTPTMGGVLIWGTVIVVLVLLAIGRLIFPDSFFDSFYFLSRSQTLLPLGVLVFAALIGLVDDVFDVLKSGSKGGGLTIRQRILIYLAVALIGAWWFFYKLEWDILFIPFLGTLSIGAWYIPIFIFIIVATAFAINETDGLDGLAGGVLLIAFSSYGLIAFLQQKFELAVLCAVIAGALGAFLWFNIHPARFFMGDTGAMSLGITLGVIAMLTNAALILPLILIIPVIETLSVILQLASKKFRGKKVFLSTPIHHHFQAKGWIETKITERFWLITGVVAAVGIVVQLAGQ